MAQFAFLSLLVINGQSPTFAALKKGMLTCIYTPFIGRGRPEMNVKSDINIRGMNLDN